MKIAPFGVPASMRSVNVKEAEFPFAIVLRVHVMVPPEPFGSLQRNVGPLTCDAETNVIPAGMGSVTVTSGAASGPPLTTVTTYVTSLFAAAVAGPAFVTARSASCAIALGTAATKATAVQKRTSANLGPFTARIAEGHWRIGGMLAPEGF